MVSMFKELIAVRRGRRAYRFKEKGFMGNYNYGDSVPSYGRVLDIFRAFLPEENGPVLDLASGVGTQARYLEKVGVETVRMDLADDATVNNRFSNEMTVQGNMWELPFKNNFFRGVHLKDALVHVPDKQKFLAEVGRVLVSGGILCVVSEGDCNAWDSFSRSLFSGSIYTSSGLDELVVRAEELGFSLVRESLWCPKRFENDWYSHDLVERCVLFFERE